MGERIRWYRTQLGLSQKELAEVSGVSKSMICQVESDKRTPSVVMLQSLHEILEMDLHWVITGEEM